MDLVFGALWLIVSIAIIACIPIALFWGLEYMEIPYPPIFKKVVMLIVGVIALIMVLQFLVTGASPLPRPLWLR